ncbi:MULTISPECIES: DUF1433 domain-containing protein [unclassified Granulicatella]|uniref:DUF1433 domain-containing protein n=1 Tax=unclassified Granulicatella TaxID=2630493 RepID=UPI0010736666|nr:MULTISPECIES: DUF1433 domain-containing protein [unclassified Granulicatella]MBF0779758.1 DUF1433 domain-containing protein [Granulicatella sp. 19428wC4_WM01]TFU96161.1 DUF1433 domain-containing protein [Granulicatella sp. WM01]
MKKILALLAIVVLFIGGCHMMNKKETLTKEQQDSIAQYVTNNYENIKKIEFIEATKNNKTGFNRMVAVVNDNIWISIQINSKTEEISLNHLASKNSGLFLKNKESQSKNESIQDILIIYLGESK